MKQQIARFSLRARTYLLPVALAVGVLLGCAARPVPMADGAVGRIKSVEAILVLQQRQIRAEARRSDVATAAAGVGAVAAAGAAFVDVGIESSRASAAEVKIAPVKDALSDYDFAAQLRSPVERELRQLAWMNLQTLRVEVAPDDKKIEAAIAASPADAVLVIRAGYSLTWDFSLVRVVAVATGYPKTEELTALAKQSRPDLWPPLLYRAGFYVTNGLAQGKLDRDAAVKAWADNKGQAAREALSKGAADLAKRIATDLESARAQPRATWFEPNSTR
jgi:hypothetical protein